MKASMKKALFVWYTAVHYEYAKNCKTSSCSPHDSVENTACRGRVSIPRAASATSPKRRFCCKPEHLQVAKWQSPVVLLHHVYRRGKFNRDGVNSTHNSHVWGDENPHASFESNFQLRFSANVLCAVLDDQLMGPFILEGRLTGETFLRFLQEELPPLLEDVTLDKRIRMYFQHD